MIALRGLHPHVRAWAEYAHTVARYYGVDPVVTSGFRSMGEQQYLRDRWEWCVATGRFQDGSTAGCQHGANRPGESAHNYGLAWDAWAPAEHLPTWHAIVRWAGFHVGSSVHNEVRGWRNLIS
jgi:hypothetical protein